MGFSAGKASCRCSGNHPGAPLGVEPIAKECAISGTIQKKPLRSHPAGPFYSFLSVPRVLPSNLPVFPVLTGSLSRLSPVLGNYICSYQPSCSACSSLHFGHIRGLVVTVALGYAIAIKRAHRHSCRSRSRIPVGHVCFFGFGAGVYSALLPSVIAVPYAPCLVP